MTRQLIWRKRILSGAVVAAVALISPAWAATWTYTGSATGMVKPVDESYLTFSPINNVGINVQTNDATGHTSSNWSTTQAVLKYAGIFLTPAEGYLLETTGLSFTHNHANALNGPGRVGVNDDNSTFATVTTTPTTSNFPLSISSFNTTTLKIQGYGSGTKATQSRLTLNNITITGEVRARASLSASASLAPATRVIRGATNVQFGVDVQNDALAGGTAAAQSLDYTLSHSGGSGTSVPPGPGPFSLAGGATVTHHVDVDTTTAGRKEGGTLSVASTNAYRANGTVGQNSTSTTLGYVDVIDHANGTIQLASDADAVDSDVLNYVFNVDQNDDAFVQVRISNMIADALAGADYTAKLKYGSVIEQDNNDRFTLTAPGVLNDLAASSAGEENWLLSVLLDTSTPGTFTGSYTFAVGDEDLVGASATPELLKLNLTAVVSPVSTPEPGALALVALSALGLLRRRSR